MGEAVRDAVGVLVREVGGLEGRGDVTVAIVQGGGTLNGGPGGSVHSLGRSRV